MAVNRRAVTVVPAPINVLPSQAFLGDDGQWSTFTVSVGTPPQKFRVLPSTKGSETWVILPDGCISTDPSDCYTQRGGENFNGSPSKGFLTNQSSTWDQIGLYTINTEKRLDDTASGLFGTDVVGLNGGNGSANGVSLDKQTVGGIATKDFFLGILGLSTAPSSFSSAATPAQTLLQNLFDNNLIPSMSYAYTAGASYGTNGQYNWGSLVLGGYDSTKLKPDDQISIPFSSQDTTALTVGVQSIIATNVNNGTASFTSAAGGHLSLIDSTESQIWLPRAICDQFEGNLGLVYDNATNLYLLNSTQHDTVKAMNPSFTFKIGQTAFDNGKGVNIVFPYSAFDLTIGWPTYDRTVNYFPIRRAANDSQYTLGRAFLQQAHITVDFGSNNFSIAPANFPETTIQPHLVAISGSETKSEKSGISIGAIVGIAVGAFVLLLLAALAFCVFRRRRTSYKKAKLSELDANDTNIDTAYSKVPGIHEADGEEVVELPASYGSTYKHTAELEGPAPVFEMEGDSTTLGGTPSSMGRIPTPYTSTSGRGSTPFSPASGMYSPAQPSPMSVPQHSPQHSPQ